MGWGGGGGRGAGTLLVHTLWKKNCCPVFIIELTGLKTPIICNGAFFEDDFNTDV